MPNIQIKCHQSDNSFTGPPKVDNVTFGRTRVVSKIILQDISWNAVQLQNDETKYIIQYDTRLPTAPSNTNSYRLMLKVPIVNTTFTVKVAAIWRKPPSVRGDYSDPQFINYTSTYIW